MTAGQVQAGAAVAMALALHLGAFALGPSAGGAAASGKGGADLLSLQAANGAMAALVAEWDRPPMTPAPPAAAMARSDPADDPPVRRSSVDESPVAPRPTAPPTLPTADAAPVADPAPSAPVPEVRPKQKPQKRAKPAPEAPPSAASQPAQKAAGSGGGAQAGDGGTAKAATLSQARIDDLTAGWGAAIRARIEKRKRYPAGADGATGSVTVRLTVTRAGALAGVSVTRSSGHDALDAAAVQAVRAAGKFPAAPKGLDRNSYSFTLAMKFAR